MGILNDLVKMDFMKQGSGAVNDLVAYNNYQDSMKQLGELQSLYSQKKMVQLDNLINQNPQNPAFSPTGGYPPSVNSGQNMTNVNQNTGANQQGSGALDPFLLQQIMSGNMNSGTVKALMPPTQQNTTVNQNPTTPPQVQPNIQPQPNAGGNPPANQAGIYREGGVLSEDLLRAVLPGGVDKSKYYKTLARQDNTNNQMFADLMKEVNNPWMQINGTYDNVYKNFTDQDTEMRKEIKPTLTVAGDKGYENYMGVNRQVFGMPPKLDPEIEKLKQDKLPKKTKFAAFTTTPKVGDTEFIVTHWQEVDEKGNPVFIKDPVTGKDIPKIIEQTDINGNPYHPSDDGSGRRLDFQEKERRLYPNLSKVEDNFKQIQKIKPTQVIDKDGKPTGKWEYRVETKDGSGKYRAFKTQEELLKYAFENTEKEFFEANEVLEKHYGREGTVKVNGKPLLTEMVNSLERLLRQNKGRLDELNPGTGNKKRYDLVNDIIDKVYADKIPTKDIENLRLWLKAKMLNGDLGL
jgi:hypothetical protein